MSEGTFPTPRARHRVLGSEIGRQPEPHTLSAGHAPATLFANRPQPCTFRRQCEMGNSVCVCVCVCMVHNTHTHTHVFVCICFTHTHGSTGGPPNCQTSQLWRPPYSAASILPWLPATTSTTCLSVVLCARPTAVRGQQRPLKTPACTPGHSAPLTRLRDAAQCSAVQPVESVSLILRTAMFLEGGIGCEA